MARKAANTPASNSRVRGSNPCRAPKVKVSDVYALTEKTFMHKVMTRAKELDFNAYHTHDSRRSEPGFPDCTFVKDGRLIFAELKTEKGRTSHAQKVWLAALKQVRGVEVYLWRPSDMEEIERVLMY